MKATVTTGFRGCRDGEVVTQNFEPGDPLEGEIAQVAVENGWAKAEGKKKPKAAAAAN